MSLLLATARPLPARADEHAVELVPPAQAVDPTRESAGDSAGEPSVAELQRAALEWADLGPERERSWQRRVRAAGVAPSLTMRLGHGGGQLHTEILPDGSERVTIDAGEDWRFEVAATWTLDRLVFDRNELLVSHQRQRNAYHRERIVAEVAAIYFERRRAQLALHAEPPQSALLRADAELKIAELTALLDGMTGGALTHRHKGRN